MAERDHPGVQIGSYPFFREGGAGANFVIRSPDEAARSYHEALVEAVGRCWSQGRLLAWSADS